MSHQITSVTWSTLAKHLKGILSQVLLPWKSEKLPLVNHIV